MRKHVIKIVFSIIFLLTGLLTMAQSLQHPIIYATNDERAQVLDKVNNTTWGMSLYNSMKSNVDGKLATHQTNPASIFSTVTFFPANSSNSESYASPYASAHGKVLSTASYSAMLYFITEDEKYAKFAGDILAYYFDVLSARSVATTTICGNYFYDGRKTYNHLAVAYDFVYNYLDTEGTTVYNKATNTRVPFDKAKAQKAITNIVGNILNETGGYDTWGRFISNHPVLTAPGALFPILCVEDDTERERLFNVFWERGTKRQNSFKNTILKMFGEQGIWPESTSYSFMPNIQLILNVVDRVKPELNVISENLNIFEGAFLFENLRVPDRRFVRFGDSKRETDATDNLYRYTLNVAKRKGYTDLQEKAEISLQQYYAAEPYNPTVPADAFDNYRASDLFWGEQLPTGSVEKYNYSPTVVIKHAGIALQRNYVDVNNINYGLCGYIGGAHYVHSHATGIAMELYGAGYVMAPNGGLPPSVADRSLPEHVKYFRIYAGNNTIIVNGTSRGIQPGAWNSNSYLWQNTTVNIDAEPKHLEGPISPNFSFATQFLDDNVNNCDQQRTLSIIRTSDTTAYYFDMFRSKSNITNNFHDYVYHNLGDETTISNSQNQALAVSATDRYKTNYPDPVESPGWKFFESTQVTAPTSDAVKVRFRLSYNNRYMHMFMPGGVEREYTKALAPPTREALNGYVKKKTQVVAIRQQGEAWDRPYISVFEPSLSANASVSSVLPIETDGKIIGAVVTSIVNGAEIKDYIISLEKEDSVFIPEYDISFKGRFGIMRKEPQTENSDKVTLYIGSGESMKYGDLLLLHDGEKKNVQTFSDVPKYTNEGLVKLTSEVIGNGTISIQPEMDFYPVGSQVTFIAQPDSGHIFEMWSQDLEGTTDSITLTLFSGKSVTAHFRQAINYDLTVSSEHGSVLQSIEGTSFVEQSCIELTAAPNEGYVFENWSGDVSSTENPITVCFNANKNITANYILQTSVANIPSASILVYPNPSVGFFEIKMPVANNWSVFDYSGKLMITGAADGDFELNLSGYNKSLYLLRIQTDNGLAYKRLVIN